LWPDVSGNDGHLMAVRVEMTSENLSDLPAPTGDDDAHLAVGGILEE
jgi:hypothetical protein